MKWLSEEGTPLEENFLSDLKTEGGIEEIAELNIIEKFKYKRDFVNTCVEHYNRHHNDLVGFVKYFGINNKEIAKFPIQYIFNTYKEDINNITDLCNKNDSLLINLIHELGENNDEIIKLANKYPNKNDTGIIESAIQYCLTHKEEVHNLVIHCFTKIAGSIDSAIKYINTYGKEITKEKIDKLFFQHYTNYSMYNKPIHEKYNEISRYYTSNDNSSNMEERYNIIRNKINETHDFYNHMESKIGKTKIEKTKEWPSDNGRHRITLRSHDTTYSHVVGMYIDKSSNTFKFFDYNDLTISFNSVADMQTYFHIRYKNEYNLAELTSVENFIPEI
ncbi:hypothetical protein [Candidatus Fukatsuia symbiotica]|nr:hypothetical protein [Candidatus Fukatsuia symbiotica]